MKWKHFNFDLEKKTLDLIPRTFRPKSLVIARPYSYLVCFFNHGRSLHRLMMDPLPVTSTTNSSSASNDAHLLISEYASVGYMAKRIQMRKNRYQNLQKAADAKKAEVAAAAAAAAAPPPPPQVSDSTWLLMLGH